MKFKEPGQENPLSKTISSDETLDEYLAPAETARIFNVSPVTLWRWERAGEFPKRKKLGPRRCGHSKRELLQKQRELMT